MPEAPVNKHGNTELWKCKVGRSQQFDVPAPTHDFVGTKYLHHA
jgi:hypothetical protein